jgi:hypothetical protein
MIRKFAPVIVLTCFFILTAYTQQIKLPVVFNGKWITANQQTAFEIINDSIRPIYKQEDGKWQQTYWKNETDIFDTASIVSTPAFYKGRAVRKSLIKARPVKGSLEITYITDYTFYKIEQVNKKSIRVWVAGPYTLYRNERTNPDEYRRKEKKINDAYTAGKMVYTSYLLYRLKE